jgi:hypothetical protein
MVKDTRAMGFYAAGLWREAFILLADITAVAQWALYGEFREASPWWASSTSKAPAAGYAVTRGR